jgi:hypothetical protein
MPSGSASGGTRRALGLWRTPSGSPEHATSGELGKNLSEGVAFSTEPLVQDVMPFDARALGRRFPIPLFIFQGGAIIFRSSAALAPPGGGC